jgi:hypothetical protein
MDLMLLKRDYFFQNSLDKNYATYYNRKDIGLAIAMVKFEDFQTLFIESQYWLSAGMKKEPKVIAADGDIERAQKDYQFLYLKQAAWANHLKHKGAITFEKGSRIKVRIWNCNTGKTVFSNEFIEPENVSLEKIQECLLQHNDKIVEYVDSLYFSLGLDDLRNSMKKYSYNSYTLNTTNLKIEFEE